jgi:hypothetical protein
LNIYGSEINQLNGVHQGWPYSPANLAFRALSVDCGQKFSLAACEVDKWKQEVLLQLCQAVCYTAATLKNHAVH